MTSLLLFSLLITSTVHAQEYSGSHGGMSVVCRNEDGSIRSVSLLDTYEARNLHRLKTLPENMDRESFWKTILERLENFPYLRMYVESYRHQIDQHIIRLPETVELKLVNDAFPILSESHCSFEQLAVTQGDRIYIATRLEKWLNSLDREALLLHEILFYLQRKHHWDHLPDQISDSTPARQLLIELIADSFSLERAKMREQKVTLGFSGGKFSIHHTQGTMMIDIKEQSIEITFLGTPQKCSNQSVAPTGTLVFMPHLFSRHRGLMTTDQSFWWIPVSPDQVYSSCFEYGAFRTIE